MTLTFILYALIVILVCWLIVTNLLAVRSRKNPPLPPGPRGVPVLGYLPFLGSRPHVKITELGEIYGSVFSLQMGSYFAVILNDWKAVKAALVDQGEVFSGRPLLDLFEDVGGRKGIISTDGQVWREQRRFSLSRLRDLGFGKRSLESVIKEEVDELCSFIEKHEGKSEIDFKNALFAPVLNIIWGLVASKKFDWNNEENVKFKDLVREVIYLSGISYHIFMPSALVKLGLGRSLRTRRAKALLKFVEYMKQEIKLHLDTLPQDEPRDFFDSYLMELKKLDDNPDRATSTLSAEQLSWITTNFFLAGLETTATSLSWLIVYMVHYPEVLRKIHEEMDSVLGVTRAPCLEDRALLPYTSAVIMEVQRMAAIVPLSLLHRNTKETTLLNYHIPRNSIVFPNLWNIAHSTSLWGDPENFRPERFLNEHGVIVKPEYFIPFSAGPRVCLGESLAKMELFLFFANLCHRFTFKNPPGKPLPDLVGEFGVTLGPATFSVIAENRF